MSLILMLSSTTDLSSQYSEQKSIHLSVNDGIPSSTCYDILQDVNGFIWIATEGGLAKYDGQEFELFTSRDGPIDNEIISIRSDDRNRIWMNTSGILSYIENDSIKTIPSKNNLTLNWNFHILDGPNDYLWVSRIHELKLYNSKTLEEIDFDDSLFNVPNYKTWLIGTVDEKVLMYYQDGFIYEFIGEKISNKYYFGDVVKNLSVSKKSFKLIYPYLFYTVDEGCRMLNLKDKSDISILKTNQSVRQIEKQDNDIWILTDVELKHLSLDEDFNVTEQQRFLTNQNCSKFLIDNDGNLWTAIYKNGIYFFPRLNKNVVTTDFGKIGSNNLESILVSEKRIIAGSEKGEIFVIEDGNITKHEIKSKLNSVVDRVLDIIEIEDNQYLVSCDSGLYLFRNGVFKHLINTNSKNVFVSGKRVIICCYNQTYEANLDDLIDVNSPIFPNNDDIGILKLVASGRSYSSLIDSNNNLWIADVGRGLTKMTATDTIYFKNHSSIFNATISRLTDIGGGMLAAATKGEGVIIINQNNEVNQFNTKNGLISDYCYDISSDGERIFVATNRGACIIDPIDISKNKYKIRTYNTSNGLETNEVLDVRYSNDKLFLAMNKGMAEIQIEKEEKLSQEKKVFVKVFRVNGQNRQIKNSYSFESHENDILIQYISPNFNKDQRTVYRYKLEGVDKDWINTTSIETHYSNLDPGNYIFKYGLNQNENSKGFKSISIDIKPSFIDSIWFKMLCLAFFAFFIILPIIIYINRKRKNELETLVKEKTVEIEEKMKLIADTNAQLISSNKELEQFAYIASHDLQEPINTISSFGKILKRKYADKGDQELFNIIKIMSDSSDRMKALVKDLLVFSRIGREELREEIDLNALLKYIKNDLKDSINISKSKIEVEELPKVIGNRMELRSLFLNLISNAIKYQKLDANPIIRISAKTILNGFEFTVEDNGIGISDTNKDKIFEIFKRLHNKEEYEGTGIGLAQCKKIVELHKGKIWVESELGKGSKFKFTIIT